MQQAPFYDDVAFGPTGGAAYWLKTADGVRIRVGHWPTAGAKGTILLFPGRTEYIEKYGDAAGEFAKAGYTTVAIDWRGQGLADRLLDDPAVGYVGEFADYQIDVAAVIAYVAALNLPKPYFLIGHSLGGCIGLQALHEGLAVNAVAFSAPMWGIMMAPYMRPVAWGTSWVAGVFGQSHRYPPGQVASTYVLRESFGANTLTRDETMWNRLKQQLTAHPDLALGGPSLHWLNCALREMLRLARLPSPNVPAVTFLGTAEAVVDPSRIKSRMARWPNGELVILDKAEHEVMLEIPATRGKVFAKMIAHFDAHL